MATDQIHIRGLHVHAGHGVYAEEREEGRAFTVDLDAFVATRAAGESDALDHTVDYRALTRCALRVLEGPGRNLIETLAESIADEVLHEISAIERVRVSVWKRALGVPGDPERVGVTIERAREAGKHR